MVRARLLAPVAPVHSMLLVMEAQSQDHCDGARSSSCSCGGRTQRNNKRKRKNDKGVSLECRMRMREVTSFDSKPGLIHALNQICSHLPVLAPSTSSLDSLPY